MVMAASCSGSARRSRSRRKGKALASGAMAAGPTAGALSAVVASCRSIRSPLLAFWMYLPFRICSRDPSTGSIWIWVPKIWIFAMSLPRSCGLVGLGDRGPDRTALASRSPARNGPWSHGLDRKQAIVRAARGRSAGSKGAEPLHWCRATLNL